MDMSKQFIIESDKNDLEHFIFKNIKNAYKLKKNQVINYGQYNFKYIKYYVYIIYSDGERNI